MAACAHLADGCRGWCGPHYARWRAAAAARPGLDAGRWQLTEPPIAEGGHVSLHGLPPLVMVQVLFGVWRRAQDGVKTGDISLRMACRVLASQQVTTVGDCQASQVSSKAARSLLRSFARDVRRALADPAAEQARDIWDLAVFGHRGRLDFGGITQPWLREAAKRWAAQDLPRRRGKGHANVRIVINATARLSESLRARPDHGTVPSALSRRDAENFLNRLGYLESQGTISRYQRNKTCTSTRAFLTGIRALGLTRPGQPAAGLPGDIILTAADIPALAGRGEPGRDLPPEIMAALCALDQLEPAEVRTAVQIAIDTGRRPEDITGLPLDCLARDAGGAPVLIYDNAKAGRLARRLPVSQDTAQVIIAQQHRVTARFPGTPRAGLVLLPSPLRNPGGHRPISLDMLEGRHRDWVAGLGPLRTAGGAVFDPAKIVPYAYRHTYAQRHADAGVPIDVLAGLLDHRDLDITRGYYRVGEDRRRDAVDKVTAMQFDRHGNRIWRGARTLLDAEHARYAVGQVAVPYGTCSEPSNVAAGGGACPVRFRCAGCDHFRTDVSYLPDLAAHLDDLLRTRERLAAASGIDDWARADATPSGEEITRIRRLINQINGDIACLARRRTRRHRPSRHRHPQAPRGQPRHARRPTAGTRPGEHSMPHQHRSPASTPRRHRRPGRHPRVLASRPARRLRTRPAAHRPHPPARKTALRSTRRASMAPVRARRTRRHRRPEPQNHPPRTASRRPAPPARRTRPGPRRLPRRQPRAHDPAQPRRHDTPAMNLHHTCHVR